MELLCNVTHFDMANFRDVLLIILQRRFCDIVNCNYDSVTTYICLEILCNHSININQYSSILFPKRYREHLYLPLVEQTGRSTQNLQHWLIYCNDSFDSVHEKDLFRFFSFFFSFSTSVHQLVATVNVILVIEWIIYSTILFQNTDSFKNETPQ